MYLSIFQNPKEKIQIWENCIKSKSSENLKILQSLLCKVAFHISKYYSISDFLEFNTIYFAGRGAT